MLTGRLTQRRKNLSIPTIVITFHCMAILTGRWCRKKDSGYYQSGPGSKEDRVKYEKQSQEEMLEEVRTYVQRPTDHSTLPSDERFMSRVVAYDLPIGYCWHSWDKAGLEELRRQADWLESDDYYFSGKLTVPPIPPAIKQDVAEDAEQRKAEEKARLRNVQLLTVAKSLRPLQPLIFREKGCTAE